MSLDALAFDPMPDEPKLTVREARQADSLQRKALQANAPGFWERFKRKRSDAVCAACGRSLYGFRPDATTCSEVCKKRTKRRREGAGTPERRQAQLDALAVIRLEDRGDGPHAPLIPGAKVQGSVNDRGGWRADNEPPKIRARQSGYGFASTVRCVECGAHEKCGCGALRKKLPGWDRGMAAAPQPKSTGWVDDGGGPPGLTFDPAARGAATKIVKRRKPRMLEIPELRSLDTRLLLSPEELLELPRHVLDEIEGLPIGSTTTTTNPELEEDVRVTQTQYQTVVTLLRRSDERLQRLEDRLAYQYPTENEMREQLEAEVDSILASGGGLKVFADD
jgi:hypothetical protein